MSLFDPHVPTGIVKLSFDYKNIKNNMQQLDTSFGVNHTLFSATPNNGKHTFVEMPIQGTIPPTGLATGEGTLYTNAVNSVSSSTETGLFYTPDNGGNQYQLTRTIGSAIATFGTYTNYPTPVANQNGGWTFLPGGLLLQYGDMLSTGSNTIITFPIPFTDSVNAPYSLTATRQQASSSGATYGVISATNTGFTFTSSSSSSGTRFYWMAIGR